MKLITRDTDYAINALYYMAENRGKVYTVTELTEKLNIPRAFLRKILQILNKKELVKSSRGKGGGFRLNVDPGKILLLEVMEIFQGKFSLNECILNKNICPGRRTCALKKKIDKVEEYVESELRAINLESLMQQNY